MADFGNPSKFNRNPSGKNQYPPCGMFLAILLNTIMDMSL